jgi:hypothetical protein
VFNLFAQCDKQSLFRTIAKQLLRGARIAPVIELANVIVLKIPRVEKDDFEFHFEFGLQFERYHTFLESKELNCKKDVKLFSPLGRFRASQHTFQQSRASHHMPAGD